MNAMTITATPEKRMLSILEAAEYIGMGKTKARIWLEEIHAIRKIGSRVLCDKSVIDAYLDSLYAH